MQSEEYMVNSNIHKYLKYRKFDILTPLLNKASFDKEYEQNGFYQNLAMTKKGDGIIAVLLHPHNKQTAKTQDFQILIKNLENTSFAKMNTEITATGKIDEIIIVVPKILYGKKHINQVFNNFKTSSSSKVKLYRMHPITAFATIIPESKSVPPHEIATKEEIDFYLKRDKLQLSNMMKIYEQDPPAIWLGASAGQIIKITRQSETCVATIVYRYVVEGKK